MKKFAIGLSVISCVVMVISSCGKKDANSPGVEFMPDMYRSPSFETNMSTVFQGDTMSANRTPVAGSIARGYLPYPYANDTSGYPAAGRNLKNPLSKDAANLAEGEVLYGKFCVHCHGATGGGDGLVGLKLGDGIVPSYTGTLKNLPEGKIFHSITYGKGLMGPHGLMLNQEERWKLVLYVQKLQNPNGAAPAVADTAVAVTADIKAKEETTK